VKGNAANVKVIVQYTDSRNGQLIDTTKKTITTAMGETGWVRQSVTLTPVAFDFIVVIQGNMISSTDIIAIDDESFSEGCVKSPFIDNNPVTTTPKVPVTTPPQVGCGPSEFRCSDDVCIYGIYRCDGVRDCAGGEDEDACPTGFPICDAGNYLCLDDNRCHSSSQQCDGRIDCQHLQPDESLCGICPVGYCENGGQCKIGTNGEPYCVCDEVTHFGPRCQKYQKPAPPTTPPPNTPATSTVNGGAVAGIVIGVLVGLVVLAGSCIYATQNNYLNSQQLAKLKQFSFKSSGSGGDGSKSYGNPIFDTYGSSTFAGSSSYEATEMKSTPSKSTGLPGSSGMDGLENPNYMLDDGLQTFGPSSNA